MTGSEFQNEIDFNESLTVGQIVRARWTNSFNQYDTGAEVVKVNAKSLRVKLTKNHGPYAAGHVIVLPKVYANTWSSNNGAFPMPRYLIKCDECKQEIGRTDSLRDSAAGGTCDDCRRARVA